MKKISPARYIHVWKALVQVANLKSNPRMTKREASSPPLAPLRELIPLRVKNELKIKYYPILTNGVSFQRYDFPDFEFLGFRFPIPKVSYITGLNWSKLNFSKFVIIWSCRVLFESFRLVQVNIVNIVIINC